MAGDRGVQIGRDVVGNVITTEGHNLVEAHVTSAKREAPVADPATVDVAKELTAIRALLTSLESEHVKKIGRALDDADEEVGKKTAVTAAAFSPNGACVVTGSYDGTARVWDAHTSKPLTEPLQHRQRVTAAAFSPDGTRVVTAARCSPFVLENDVLVDNHSPCP